MKRLLPFFAAMSLVTIMTGCDALRKLAGRPVSADIENFRKALSAAEAARQKAFADSVARADSLLRVRQAEEIEREKELLEHAAYYIVVGTFQEYSNATQLLSKFRDAGYLGRLQKLRSGATAVYIAPCNTKEEAVTAYNSVVSERFCPRGAWIWNAR